MFSRRKTDNTMKNSYNNTPTTFPLSQLKISIENAEAIVIGAGAGLSTSAGLTYDGERFYKYFFDFAQKYGIQDMYSGGFYPFPDEQTRWAWWARHIYYNRYIDAPKPVYHQLLSLVKNKNYFVITTNVDHQFQKAGFDKKRLFYTQGDYGLFQSINPSIQKTYDNEQWVAQAMESQNFQKDQNGIFQVPPNKRLTTKIPVSLIPKCPDDGSDMTTNLRADNTFVQDPGWYSASTAYTEFLHKHENQRVLYLELGVGLNTPGIIKYPFWWMTATNPRATYACINYGEASCPKEIADQSILVNADIGEILSALLSETVGSDEL